MACSAQTIFGRDLQLAEAHLLFHNYETLKGERCVYQMDTVFICQRFSLIVELKHIAGEISYEAATHQFLRVSNGQVLALADPFSRVLRHEALLQQMLWEIGVDVPIVTAVVVTTSSSILGEMPGRFHIFKLPGLRIKLHDWLEAFPVVLDENMLQLVREEMLAHGSTRFVMYSCVTVLYVIAVRQCTMRLHQYRLLVSE